MKISHSLINKEINDINTDGLEDEYEEFTNSDFSNSFTPLEGSDYEIRASKKGINKNSQEDIMKNTRKKASYVGQLTSGFDATVQDDYEAGNGQKGQAGKGHEEEVAPRNNWTDDKRDAVGRAASVQLRRTAARLTKLADILESQAADDQDLDDDIELDDDFEEEDLIDDDSDEVADDDIDDEGDISDEEYEELLDETAACSGSKKQAAHPLERGDDSPKSEMSSKTGDEWIDIGPGSFGDKRDEVGKAD